MTTAWWCTYCCTGVLNTVLYVHCTSVKSIYGTTLVRTYGHTVWSRVSPSHAEPETLSDVQQFLRSWIYLCIFCAISGYSDPGQLSGLRIRLILYSKTDGNSKPPVKYLITARPFTTIVLPLFPAFYSTVVHALFRLLVPEYTSPLSNVRCSSLFCKVTCVGWMCLL